MSSLRVPSLLAASLLLAGPASRALADNNANPFLPPAAAAASTAPAQDANLELRGIMAAGDSTMFSIYDSTHHMSAWTKLNDVGRDFIVRSYDASKETVSVDYQGRTLTLALHTAKVVSAPVNALPVQNAPGGPTPQPIGGPVVLNPTPADEQRRLEAIAAEVNRRRMIRQQAIQANRTAAGQPTPQTPQGQPARR